MPNLPRQLHHSPRPQPTIQMVMQKNLGRGNQLLGTDHAAIFAAQPHNPTDSGRLCNAALHKVHLSGTWLPASDH